MKKISMLVGVLSVMAIVSCKEKEETPDTTTHQTIEVTNEAPAVEENPDGTSVSIGSDGIDVSTKSGANQTKVNVSGCDAKVEVKK